jgi:SAM-dependent methyltransferase
MNVRHETVAAMDRHWWYRGRRAAVDSLLWRAGARPPAGARSQPDSRPETDGARRILDYGCGVGNMGATLARYGDVWGVEADPDALAAGDFSAYAGVVRAASVAEAVAAGDDVPTASDSRRGDAPCDAPPAVEVRAADAPCDATPAVDVRAADAPCGAGPAGKLPGGAFDIVTCLDVLEHVEDDAGLLRDLRALLGPDGVMVVSAPLHPDLFCAVDEIAGHLRRYTAEGLRGLLRGADLRPAAESGYVVGLLPLARRQRRRVQAGRAAPEQEWAVPPAPVNAVLSAVAMAEGKAARWVSLPAGLSLLIAARHSASAQSDAHMV